MTDLYLSIRPHVFAAKRLFDLLRVLVAILVCLLSHFHRVVGFGVQSVEKGPSFDGAADEDALRFLRVAFGAGHAVARIGGVETQPFAAALQDAFGPADVAQSAADHVFQKDDQFRRIAQACFGERALVDFEARPALSAGVFRVEHSAAYSSSSSPFHHASSC